MSALLHVTPTLHAPPVHLSAFRTLTLHADATDDPRGDFWQDATIHFRIAENPRQDVAGPIVPGSEPPVPGHATRPPHCSRIPRRRCPATRACWFAPVMPRPPCAVGSRIPEGMDDDAGWTGGIADRSGRQNRGLPVCAGRWRGRIAQSGSLTVPSDGSWQKMVVPPRRWSDLRISISPMSRGQRSHLMDNCPLGCGLTPCVSPSRPDRKLP